MFTRDSMMARLALLFGICLVTSGSYSSCTFISGSGSGTEQPDGDSFTSTLTLRNVSGVETVSFVFGEPVRFDFEIVNRANRQVRVQFPDAQTHDYLVLNSGSSQIRWKWSDGQSFAQVASELVFEPYASKTVTLIWAGTLADGTQLPTGNYRARALLVFDGYETNPLAQSEMASSLEPFTVR